jgi:TPR repeat protein
MSLLKYSYGGYVFKNLIDNLIDIIELDYMKPNLFDFLKNCFEFSYFVSNESNTREILFTSSFCKEYFQLEKENLQLQIELDLLPKIEKTSINPEFSRLANLFKQHRWDRSIRKQCFENLNDLAKKGDPEACWRVAACYNRGFGVRINQHKAKIFAEIAIAHDLPEGFFWLAHAHWNQNTKKNEYLKIASDLNFPNAQIEYGYYLLKNSNDEITKEQGKQLIILGGENGDSYCAKRLSDLYNYYNQFAPTDRVKGAQYQQIANQRTESDCSILMQ